jgi:hypothetical protein
MPKSNGRVALGAASPTSPEESIAIHALAI